MPGAKPLYTPPYPSLFATSLLLMMSCGARTTLLGGDTDGGEGASGTAGQGVDAGVDAASPPAVSCTPGAFPLEKADPALMLLLDRSRSMNAAFSSDGETRWEVLTQALASALPPVDDTMAIGALAYPKAGSEAQTCVVADTPDLVPALGNASTIVTIMVENSPEGATPTADAIDVGGSALLAFRAASTARTIVLATDGGPDCNTALDPSTCRCVGGTHCSDAKRCLDDTRTVERIASFAAQGIPTYVIGIQSADDSRNSDVLDAMALAGTRPQTGAAHHYYAATSKTELQSALVAIRDQVGACTFLTRSVPNEGGAITVAIGGVEIPYDPTGVSGWSWADRANGEIELFNDACTLVTQAGVAPIAEVSCAASVDAGADASQGTDPADARMDTGSGSAE